MQLSNAGISRRSAIAGLSGLAAAAAYPGPLSAATKVRFLTAWYAEAEHGGFYQAKATGLYAKEGLDVEIKMGGPQLNALQLLTGGDTDFMMGADFQMLNAVDKGVPVVTVGASFQFDMLGIMAHSDVKSLADLKGRRILLSASAHQTYWPWLREKYGFSDDQVGPYTNNLQPFFNDPNIAQQAYATAEPFQAQNQHLPVSFFLLAKEGYPPYACTIATTRPYMESNSDVVARFVRASFQGWKSYLANPAPGNALIKLDNPKMTDDQLAFSINALKALRPITGGDAGAHGIGTITESRWSKTRDFLVRAGLLKESTDWRSAFTTQYVANLHVV
jgi:NitT/TauT family transport system substrate-binding protein